MRGVIFNAFINLEPVQRSANECDVRKIRSSLRCEQEFGA